MKTIKFIITLFLATQSIKGQITKTNWLVGGNISLNNSKSEITDSNGQQFSNSSSNIRIEPNVGYFLFDKFALGLKPTLALSFTDEKTIALYGIGSFARYYFLKPENRVNLLSQIGYAYSWNNQSSSKINEFYSKLGTVVFFNESVGLEVSLDYNFLRSKSDFDVLRNNTFTLNFGFQIHLDK